MGHNTIDVLLVEDNSDDAELAIRELKRSRLANKVVHVKDGQAALEFLYAASQRREGKEMTNLPKVILLDIHMPKASGIEVLQKIKSDETIKTTPVVILTSSNQDPIIQRCFDLGANSYITKPLDFEKFSEAIQSLGFYWLLLNEPPV